MSWTVSEPDVARARARFSRPLDALALGEVAAIVLRGVFEPSSCSSLVDRLIERGHLYDPREPVPDKFLSAAVPEGFFSRATAEESIGIEHYRQQTRREHVRIDIGTSLGQPHRQSGSDTASGPGDQGDLPLQTETGKRHDGTPEIQILLGSPVMYERRNEAGMSESCRSIA